MMLKDPSRVWELQMSRKQFCDINDFECCDLPFCLEYIENERYVKLIIGSNLPYFKEKRLNLSIFLITEHFDFVTHLQRCIECCNLPLCFNYIENESYVKLFAGSNLPYFTENRLNLSTALIAEHIAFVTHLRMCIDTRGA